MILGAALAIATQQPDGLHFGQFIEPKAKQQQCITPEQYEKAREQIADFQREYGTHGTEGTTQKYVVFPIGGKLWSDVFPNNFCDMDPTSGIRDYDGSDYTYNGHQGHDIDIRNFGEMQSGYPVFAALGGQVSAVSDFFFDQQTNGSGSNPANYVIIYHGGSHYSYYWHLKTGSVQVKVGDIVSPGQQLGLVGSSGASTGPHLHFESQNAGTWFEPNNGPFNTRPSNWERQIPFDRSFYIRDLNMSFADFSTYPGLPYDLHRSGTFVKGSPSTVGWWTNAINLPANSTWRVRVLRPNGTQIFDSGLGNFGSNPFYRWSWWWWRYNFNLDTVGQWKLRLTMNSTTVDVPFTVVDHPSQRVNRPPNAVSVKMEPAVPEPGRALQCAVEPNLLLDDPDFDIVRYRYRWTIGPQVIRDVTHSGSVDMIPANAVVRGREIKCEVTPSDGQANGPSSSVSGEAGVR